MLHLNVLNVVMLLYLISLNFFCLSSFYIRECCSSTIVNGGLLFYSYSHREVNPDKLCWREAIPLFLSANVWVLEANMQLITQPFYTTVGSCLQWAGMELQVWKPNGKARNLSRVILSEVLNENWEIPAQNLEENIPFFFSMARLWVLMARRYPLNRRKRKL